MRFNLTHVEIALEDISLNSFEFAVEDRVSLVLKQLIELLPNLLVLIELLGEVSNRELLIDILF